MGAVWRRLQRIAYAVKEAIKSDILGNSGIFMLISSWTRTSTPNDQSSFGRWLAPYPSTPLCGPCSLSTAILSTPIRPQGAFQPSNYLPSLWSGHQFEVVGGVEWALSGNVDVRFG
uniref:Uncharacterized protein n=1 Tax=Cryptococcus bacillisporus CA1280 TaxID=1296109 RepID=A0A0D0VDU8_CRYGA|nr:hypothetical protein I312_06027 [Cryptococcus bacillisporus CA1280]